MYVTVAGDAQRDGWDCCIPARACELHEITIASSIGALTPGTWSTKQNHYFQQCNTVLESRASVKRKDVVRRPKAEGDCLTPIASRRSEAYKAAGIYFNYRLTRSKTK